MSSEDEGSPAPPFSTAEGPPSPPRDGEPHLEPPQAESSPCEPSEASAAAAPFVAAEMTDSGSVIISPDAVTSDSGVVVIDSGAIILDEDELDGSAIETAMRAVQPNERERASARRRQIYERELALLLAAADALPKERRQAALLQHEIGELTEWQGGDEVGAIKAYDSALQSDSRHKPNLWAIRRLLEERQLWPNLVKLIDADLRHPRSAADRARLLVEKGELLEDRLDDAGGARDCYLLATEACPDSWDAWLALERSYLGAGDLAGRDRVLAALAGLSTDPARRVALTIERARLQEELPGSSPAAARDLLRGALILETEVERLFDELERSADRQGDRGELMAVLEDRARHLEAAARGLEDAATRERLVALRRRQSRLAQAMGKPDHAWQALERAAQVAPSDPVLLRERLALAETLGRPRDVSDLLALRLASAHEDERPGLLVARAAALREAGHPEEAERVEAEITGAEDHLGLFLAKERAALAAADWSALARLYAAEAARARRVPDSRWAALVLGKAAQAYAHLGRDAEAEASYRAALAEVPHDAAAVDALLAHFRRGGAARTAERVALLEEELEATPARAQSLLDELLVARTAMGDDAGALAAAQRIVTQRPDDLAARLQLYELLLTVGDRAGAAAELAAIAPRVEGADGTALRVELADLLGAQLGEVGAATKVLHEVLERQPDHPVAAPAFEAFARRGLATAGGEGEAWRRLVTLLADEAAAASAAGDHDLAVATLLRLAELHERQRSDRQAAILIYRDILRLQPEQPAALRGLARAYAVLDDPEALAEVLAQLLPGLPPAARANLLVQLGELYEDRLAAPERAAECYAQALDEDERNVYAVLGQLRVAARSREGRAAPPLARLGDLVADPAHAETPAGRTARARLLDERVALALRSGHLDTALGLERQALALDEGDRARGLMRMRLALRQRDPAAASAALAEVAAGSSDPDVGATGLRRAGLLALVAGGGAAAMQRALASLGAAAALDDAIAPKVLATLTDDPELLAQEAASSPRHPEDELALAEALGGAGRYPEAAAIIDALVQAEPHHLGALSFYCRLARAVGDERAFALGLARLGGALRAPARAASVLRVAGDIFEQLGATLEAATCWRAVLDRAPADEEAFARARQLLEAHRTSEGDAAPLVELYAHRLVHAPTSEERLPLLLERAELFAAVGAAAAAEADFAAVLAIDDRQPQARRRLGELLQAGGRREEALTHFERLLELEQEPAQRRVVLRAVARLNEALGRHAAAALHLAQGIDCLPGAKETVIERRHLVELLIGQKRWPEAVEALRKLTPLLPPGAARAERQLQIAAIGRDQLGDPALVGAALVAAVDEDPTSLVAFEQLVPLGQAGYVDAKELRLRLERAIEKVEAEVVAAPAQPEGYARLARLFGWVGDEDAVFLATQGEALAARRLAPVRSAVTALRGALDWQPLWPPRARALPLELWQLGVEAVSALYEPTLQSLGIGRRERVHEKAVALKWQGVLELARTLVPTEVELYEVQHSDLCATHGTMLVCGSSFAVPLTPALQFRLARKLALMPDHLGPLDSIDDDELTLFFAALLQTAELPLPPALAALDAARFAERGRRVQKALSRKAKKALHTVGPRVMQLPDLSLWRQAVLEGAARAALVISGDLTVALRELGLELGRDRLAEELAAFSVSRVMRRQRQRIGTIA